MHLYEDYVKMLDEYESLYISREGLGAVLSLEPLYSMIDLYVEIVDHDFSDLAQRIDYWMFLYSYVQAYKYILDKKDPRLNPLEVTLRLRLYA